MPLRQGPAKGESNNYEGKQYSKVIEAEFKNTAVGQKSALDLNPTVKDKGYQQFLVMSQGNSDPFVTVIPNSIYYNIEKKCVNWLDDCSIQGIRSRLLNTVQGPFK
ncbi:hypothetical protein ACJJTC_001013 [Scirpophaga incertulas]